MTSASFKPASGPARRTVMAAAGAAGLAAALTACGGSDDNSSSSTDTSSSAGSTGSTGGTDAGGSPSGAASSGSNGGGAALTTTAEIPEGGGKVFADQKVVVVQPKAGEFKAYSAICTHQGCPVKSIADGVINCPCHNSNFNIADGSVKSGPAKQPLPVVQITVSGDQITLA